MNLKNETWFVSKKASKRDNVQARKIRHCYDQLSLFFQGLLITNNEQLRTNCLSLINAIITTPDDLDFRMHLRNEFMRVGLVDVLYTLDRQMDEASPDECAERLTRKVHPGAHGERHEVLPPLAQ